MNDRQYKILFVDDDAFVVEMYAVKFSDTKHEVRFANSADEALQVLEGGFKPDAIVFDVMMPGMLGFDFIAEVKRRGLSDGAVLIALTNQGEMEDYNRAEDLHIDEYIIKANHIPSEVVAIIEDRISKYKQKDHE